MRRLSIYLTPLISRHLIGPYELDYILAVCSLLIGKHFPYHRIPWSTITSIDKERDNLIGVIFAQWFMGCAADGQVGEVYMLSSVLS